VVEEVETDHVTTVATVVTSAEIALRREKEVVGVGAEVVVVAEEGAEVVVAAEEDEEEEDTNTRLNIPFVMECHQVLL